MNWKEYNEIATSLEKHYPNSRVDALSLSKDALKKLIISLPGFMGDKDASNADFHIKFIRKEWIAIRMPSTDHWDDGFKDPAWRP
jgi:FeS assembly protein IscX